MMDSDSSNPNHIKGDMWSQNADAVCITTNGYVKKDSTCVMGKGCAKQATVLFPKIERVLGGAIKHGLDGGSRVRVLWDSKEVCWFGMVKEYYPLKNPPAYDVIAFPVKDVSETCNEDCSNVVSHMRSKFSPYDRVPGWACLARFDIIAESCEALLELANERGYQKIIVPRPGCGAGELPWDLIKNIVDCILDDRFYIITNGS